MTITPQTSLDERYLLVRRLAFGGMGEVWEGSDVVLDRAVAVKILRAELADDDAFRRRFRAEARTAGRVPHPGIASVYDYGETSVAGRSLAYLVMELVPGEALSTMLAREGALGTDRTLDFAAQAARALHAAHERGVIHRDVKPANLMVTPDGRVKVTDFGIARPDDHEPLTATGQVMGTAHYLAPELARGRAATPASDIYALGVVMYECLAGRRPFEGDDQIGVATAHLSEQPPPLPETLSPEVRALVAAAMEKDPADRIAGGDVLAAAAESLRVRMRSATAGGGFRGYDAGSSTALGFAGARNGSAGAGSGETALAPPPGPGSSGSSPMGRTPSSYPPASYPPGSYPSGSYPEGLLGGPPASPRTPPGSDGVFVGPPSGGSNPGGYPVEPRRSGTTEMPLVGPGSGGVPTGGPRRRSLSLPMTALAGLILAVVVGTGVAALRNGGGENGQGNPFTPTPAPVSTHRAPKPSATTTTRPTNSVVVPVRPRTVTQAPRPTRRTQSPSPSLRPTQSVSPSLPPPTSTTTTTPPTPSPPASGSTSTGPPTPTATASVAALPPADSGTGGGTSLDESGG